MKYTPYGADNRNTPEKEDARMSVEGITSLRGAASESISNIEKTESDPRQEIEHCLQNVTCRIM